MRSLDSYSFKEPQPPHQVLQELRDVSTMAIEYFDDKIAPNLRKKELNAMTSPRGIGIFGNCCNEFLFFIILFFYFTFHINC